MAYEIREHDNKFCVAKVDGEELKCYPTKEEALDYLQALEANVADARKMMVIECGPIRAFMEGEARKLELLAIPFGSPSRKDRLMQWFSSKTETGLSVGDTRPTLYAHGLSPQGRIMQPIPILGKAVVTRIDNLGYWMETTLDNSEVSTRTWNAAKMGRAGASTGAVQNAWDKLTGEVLTWIVGEVSVFDKSEKRIPVSDDAIVLPIRAIFNELDIQLPEAFEAGEDKIATRENTNNVRTFGDDKMDEKEFNAWYEAKKTAEKADAEKLAAEKATLRASILEELKGDPKHRALFNINSIKDGEDKETFEFIYNLRMAGKNRKPGLFSARTLEESEALEGGPMVPTGLLNEIQELMKESSIVRKSGMRIIPVDTLVINVPRETTAMTAPATVAEEGAYQANEPAFATTAVTQVKKGSLITVTEEMLEDQSLFQNYLTRAASFAMARAENAHLFALIDANDGTEIATQHAPTAGEVIDLYFSLTGPYRDNAVWLMNDAWLGYLYGLETSNARAFWTPAQLGGFGGPGAPVTLMGKPVFTSAENWRDKTAADDEGIIDFINLDRAIVWMERRGLQIFVDPYGDALNGRTRYFISSRFAGAVVNTAALKRLDDHS
jgi:HK97 family phage major capsid protein